MPSEFELIARYFDRPARSALLGVGDDAALVRPGPGMELAVSTDMLLEGRHFAPGAEPRALGHKALAVNLSDMAAMGATPRWALLAIALPAADETWLAGFSQGLFALADRFAVDLIGGDTTRGPLTIAITILGEVPDGLALFRAGARPGDDVWVSGALGGAALALAARSGRTRLSAAQAESAGRRLDAPEPRVELGERLRGIATSAIDISDGFAGDLRHVLERSAVGAMVHYARLPKAPEFAGLADDRLERDCVLSGGDDYELLFTAAQSSRGEIEALGADLGIALARVGAIQTGDRLVLLDAGGAPMDCGGGYDHFAS
ncbi:MAG TPA: thiamine-phosphate kinase [Burkholderiales bacterium]|nr:thiamine-phosphate kinase [Burkholderiales bacterium]